MSNKAICIDSLICVGCKSCQNACTMIQNLPMISTRLSVQDLSSPAKMNAANLCVVTFDEKSKPYIHLCRHCADALCVKKCPERAIQAYAGWKYIDLKRCIGCGSCELICPYGAVFVVPGAVNDKRAGKAVKCDGCISSGLDSPACVSSCPSGAMTYGNRNKLIKELRLKSARGKTVMRLHGIDEYGGCRVLSLREDTYSFEKTGKISFNESEAMLSKAVYAVLRFLLPNSKRVRRNAWKALDSKGEKSQG